MTESSTGGALDAGPTIVALGASAGGLEALEGFFGGLPRDPRLA